MNRILVAADGIRGFHWHGIDFGGYAERSEHLGELLEKLSHRHRPKRDFSNVAAARATHHFVRQKIEFDIERYALIARHRRGREAARSEIKSDVPPMILYRC